MSIAPAGQRSGHCGTVAAKPVEAATADAGTVAGGGSGDAQHEGRVDCRVGVGGELDLAVDQHHAGGHLARLATGGSSDPTPRLVGDPRDGARGGRDLRHQQVGVGDAGGASGGVLVLESKGVARAAGGAVQGDTRVEQHVVALVEGGVVLVGRHAFLPHSAHHSDWASRIPPWPSLTSGSRM